VPYLLAPALSSDSDAAMRDAAGQAIKEVLGATVSREESIPFLRRRLESYLSGMLPATADETGQVAIWVWDAEQQLPLLERLPAADASFVVAARLARQLHAIAPDDADHQLYYLATGLEVAKRQVGYDRPLVEQTSPIVGEGRASGTDTLEKVLALALKHRLEGAAIAVINLLGDSQNLELLKSSDGQLRLLARSLRNPARRVRCAAARAIMKLDPHSTFAGSSFLPEVLGFLSSSGGRRRVLIGDPRAEVARTLAGSFDDLGFDVDTELTGRKFVLRAFDSPDYSFALIGDAMDRPAFRELVQILRRDTRTADLPIGVMVREVNEESAKWLAATDPLTLAFPQPQTQEDIAFDTRRLLQAAGRRQLSDAERVRQASFALDALAQLAAEPDKYGFYDLMRLEGRMQTALTTAALTSKAARVLGLLGTPAAQRSLVAFASAHVHPLADRQAAAEAFRVAVQRRGLLLTRPELLRQYEVYNASEILDRETQQVLSSILDTFEAPSQKTDPSPKDD
jgi:hypothetical protein